jgi:hypothetical protein
MRIVKKVTDFPFVNLKVVEDSEFKVKNYEFAERKGVDSVAFVVYHEELNQFLINKEATPPIGKFLNRAFGGSIDKEIDYIDIVREEVKEEAGYKVKNSSIYPLGKVFVSTQMNQFCHLYLVKVKDKQKGARNPQNETEKMSAPILLTEREILEGDDWKAITILIKAKLKGFL